MDSKKISIRPILNITSEIPIENFQNTIVRPILKLQHHFILQFFTFFCYKQKVDILNTEESKFNNTVTVMITKNAPLKNQFLGIVIGQFTVKEFSFYKQNNSEINKRILKMIDQRIKDSQSEIKDLKNKQNDNRTKS